MTIDNFRTHWPLDIRFTACDIQAGEQALDRSELFCDNNLRLLCGVWLSALSPASGPGKGQPLPSRLIDYLVCKGNTVLMAVRLTDRAPKYGEFLYIPDLPVAEITSKQFTKGNVGAVLSHLRKILEKPASPAWFCRLRPCPSSLISPMLRHVLLETTDSGDTVPTEYGMCSGIVQVLQYGRRCAMCSPQALRNLPHLLTDEVPWGAAEGDKIPFADLLSAYRSGRSCNGRTSAALVQEVMDMPLAEYMDGFPRELQELQDALPGQCGTYAQAAMGIYRLLHTLCGETYNLGVDLMQNLAQPPLEDKKIADAVQMGRRVTGRGPDDLPGRYRKAQQERKIRSFSDCICDTRKKLPAGMRLTSMPQASFFQGVGLLSQSRYPSWLSDALSTDLSIAGRCPYGEVLQLAEYNLQEENAWTRGLGVRLLYLLLIEPCCLIHENNQCNETK